MLVVAIFNFKGGTGKSTMALNLGTCLADNAKRTLLVDLDGQRTLSYALGLDGSKPTALDWLTEDVCTPYWTSHLNLSLIPGDIGLFKLQSDQNLVGEAIRKLNNTFDVVLLDCPPSLSLTSVQAILNSDRVLMPTLNEPASLKGLSEAIQLIRDERPDIPIDVVRSRYKSRLILSKDADDVLIDSAVEFNYRLLHTTIPDNISIAESIAAKQSVISYMVNSAGARAYQSLAKECQKLWGLS